MGEVVEEFEETLARIHASHRDDPRRELAALLLLAMEREQLVSIAYRDELIHRRLATLSLAADVREIFRHGIAWAWKDEEMHAIYTRGLLLRIGTPWTRGRAVVAQMAGAVAGWASSVQQHARWSQAPIARTLAALTVTAGRLAGKVPRGVSDRLRYLSFRDFCELQVDAECTAARCWERVAALSERVPAISAGVRAEFRRMWQDEESHRRIFALLAAALGPDDRLAPGETAGKLVEQARSVGEFFLPRVHRSAALTDHPLGRGGGVWVVAGEAGDDKIAVFRALLDRAGLSARLAARARALGKPLGRLAVVIKPTFDHVYQTDFGQDEPISFFADREKTAAEIDRRWPGSGARYGAFVDAMLGIHRRTRPLLAHPRPGPLALLRTGAWRDVPFLLRSLGSVLARTGLPRPVRDAIAIWTHVAGQETPQAPSPMALVPALIHAAGAYYPRDGVGAIPRFLAHRAAAEGVGSHYGVTVRSIRTADGRVRGVETAGDAFVEADAVVSNAHGVGTYLALLDRLAAGPRAALARLPLQSPGVCAYLRVRTEPRPPYLRFHVPREGERCRLFVMPGVVNPGCGRDGWWPARLIAPLAHDEAQRMGPDGQRAWLDRLLAEDWWRDGVGAYEVLATRTPAEWGAEFGLYRDSMNPVMTARFMRAGRLPHRSPFVQGLYLAGSSTHPGQWVSFCAISGILAAEQLHRDLA